MTQFLDSVGAQRIVSKLRQGLSGKAATAHTHTVKINGATKSLGLDTVDLGTYLTAHQDISQYVNGIKTTGSGNIVTSVTKNGKVLTFNKDLTLSADIFVIPDGNALPTDVKTIARNKIYLIKAGITGVNDSYAEYIYTGDTTAAYDQSKWEKLGEVKVNMANYYTKSDSDGRFAAKSHSHNYAGSASAGGAATSALKLVTSANAAVTAGSATQPVYFNNGVPSACTFKLEKSVPSNAVFTDTNTWRPVQNSLTSDATDQSLSAAQGKVLKGLIDTISSKKYAGSATAGGSANSAVKLDTVTAGSSMQPVFFTGGKPVACSPAITVGEINIADLDLANKIDNYLQKGSSTRLNVIGTVSNVNAVIGVLDIFSDAVKHQITEVLTTCYFPSTSTGKLREFDKIDISAHEDKEVYTYFRTYNNAMPSDSTTRGKWSKWKEIGGSNVIQRLEALMSSAVSTGHSRGETELSLLKDSNNRGYVDVTPLVIPTATIDTWFA